MTVVEGPPAVPPAIGWTFPGRREHRLDSGLNVLVYDCPGQYVVAASLYVDVPLSAEPREREGVADLAARCLPLGAGSRSAETFADSVAACGADVGASAGPDGFASHVSVPATHLREGLALLAAMVASPRLDEAEVAQQRRLRLQEIEQATSYPQHVAVEQLSAALFAQARAGRPVGGAPDTVAAITRDDVSAYVDEHLQPTNATLAIAGDFAGVDPLVVVGEVFDDWRHAGGAVVAGEVPVPRSDPHVLLVDWPDAAQATLRLAGPGISRGDPRWPAMFVANYAVGGSFTSRLNTVLREEKGVTYGVSSGLDSGRHGGLVTVGASVRADSGAESVADILDILAAAAGTISADESVNAIRAATDSAALGFERAEAVVGRVELLLSERLGLDHVDANLARIRAVTPAAANEAYAGVLDPATLTVVVVGPAADLRGPLEALGHGPVEVLPQP